MRAQKSSLRETTISAAADGVGARRSATKSAMVTSVSCPTAEIVGTGQPAMARATTSSLNAHRSSIDPPPRPMMTTSTPRTLPMARIAARDVHRRAVALHARGANDDVRVGIAAAKDLDDVANAAPSSDVTTPILRGSAGSGRLRRAIEQPFRAQPLLQLIERQLQRAEPLRLEVLADDLVFALRVVDADPAARHDVQPVLRLEAQRAQRRAEHHAFDLRAAVLQREIHVARCSRPCSSRARLRPRLRRTRARAASGSAPVSSETVRMRRGAGCGGAASPRPSGLGFLEGQIEESGSRLCSRRVKPSAAPAQRVSSLFGVADALDGGRPAGLVVGFDDDAIQPRIAGGRLELARACR